MAISDLAAAVRTVSDASRPALMLPCENVRFVLFAIVLSVVVCAFSMPAAADDRNVCFDQTSPPDIGVTSCSAVISLSKLKDRDLITAYNRRGYFYLKKGEPDRALADLSEAIRLDQNGGLWTFLAANWAIMIGGIGAAVGWYLTYRGWAVGYNNAIDLERRKAKLQFVSDQIRYLYGPLMALCRTRRAAFDVLMKDHGKDRKNFFDYNKRTAEELRQWRLWRTEVLMPIVEKMQESILQNAHLIEEKTPARAKHPPGTQAQPGVASTEGASAQLRGEIPASFLALMSHVASYKAVIKNWAYIIEKGEKDGAMGINKIDAQQEIDGKWDPVIPHTAGENFPEKALLKELKSKLRQLKTTQATLIETTQT